MVSGGWDLSSTSRRRSLRPISPLTIPVDHEWLPPAITQFDFASLRPALRPANRDTRLIVFGRLEKIDPAAAPRSWRLCDGIGRSIHLVMPEGGNCVFEPLCGRALFIYGRIYRRDQRWHVENPEPVPQASVGRFRPVYRIHHRTARAIRRRDPQISQSHLSEAKLQNEMRLRAADPASFESYLENSLHRLFERGLSDALLREIATGFADSESAQTATARWLRIAHWPADQAELYEAREALETISSVTMLAEPLRRAEQARREHKRSPGNAATVRLPIPESIDALVEQGSRCLPFKLTASQKSAVHDIVRDLTGEQAMRRVLSGDVGTGKTAVFAVAVRIALDAGFCVGIMLPSAVLARQTVDTFAALMPDVRTSVIAGEDRHIDPEAQLWIGTVGLMELPHIVMDFKVVDEQHRFSAEQRQATADPGQHLLEATATCIPRTQAMMQAGLIQISRLTTSHVDKKIKTRLWQPGDRRRLFAQIAQDVTLGRRVFVIYPGKNISDDVSSVEASESIWHHAFPGEIAVCHGGRTDEANSQAIADLKAGRRHIMLGTSILEVGIDVPSVYRVLIVQADRFGLSSLHQFRGRVARDGGRGHCDLVLVSAVKARARRRLEYLCGETDGFRIAEFDMYERGAGDTARQGERQSGYLPKSMIPDVKPSVASLRQAAILLAEAIENEP